MSNNHPYPLPQYTAPKRVWQELELLLEQVDAAMLFEPKELPTYKAPPRIWENIAQELEQKSGSTRIKQSAFRWSAAAAVAAVLAGVWIGRTWGWAPENALSYTTETIYVERSPEKNPAELRALEIVQACCEANANACATEQFSDLRNELEKLENAREKLENALGQYGADETLNIQLSKIERERAAVLKKLVNLSDNV